jgi:hypothetical protein
MSDIFNKFINNTVYDRNNILCIIQTAIALADVSAVEIPLTVISSFANLPDKLGYYYTPAQLRSDYDEGLFSMGAKEFERAKYGVVRLKLDFSVTATGFLTTAIHEYLHAAQYRDDPEIMRIIGEDPAIVDIKEKVVYARASHLTSVACADPVIIAALAKLDEELNLLL